jgi:hypothetical protein
MIQRLGTIYPFSMAIERQPLKPKRHNVMLCRKLIGGKDNLECSSMNL